MAEATHTSNQYSSAGNRTVVTTRFTSPTDGQTWDTGLAQVDFAALTIEEASGAAADAISVASISGAIVTLDVQGTVDSALGRAEGV